MKYIFINHEGTLASYHDHPNVKKINWFDQPFSVQYLSVIQSFHHISWIEHEYGAVSTYDTSHISSYHFKLTL